MQVTIEGLTKRYGDITAVDGIDVTAEAGELTTFVGPSGCGKTTTLRSIAGLERPDEGRITIGDQVVTDTDKRIFDPPQRRNVGFVFQTFDVWPHMTVFDNVAFPLRLQDVPEDEVEERVQNILELTDIGELGGKDATDLSGGQQARVGICRALVYEPNVLLCDEPLTGLDRNLRNQMRYEIRQLQSELGITTIYVTHSQPEAMVMSDKICLMNTDGKIEQEGDSEAIYNRPSSRYAFDFFGTSQYIEGTMAGQGEVQTEIGTITTARDDVESTPAESSAVTVGFRPEQLEMSVGNHADWERNTWRGVVTQYQFLGNIHEFEVNVGDTTLLAHQNRLTDDVEEGDEVFVHLDPDQVFVFGEG